MNAAKWADLLRAYSARGFGLVALDGKAPFMSGWQKIRPAVVLSYLAEHPGANVGIRTGVAGGVVVYDYDSREKAEKFHEDLISAGGPTATVQTGGDRGGQHFYFRVAPEVNSAPSGKLDGGDFKGDGGQVVAPPSVHPLTGREYVLTEPLEKMRVWTPEVMEIAGQKSAPKQKLTPAVLEIAGQSAAPKQKEFEFIRGIASRRGVECVEEIKRQVLTVGARNETLFWLYRLLRQNGDTHAAAERQCREVNSRAAPPLSEAELRVVFSERKKVYRFSCAGVRERFNIDLDTVCGICRYHYGRGEKMISARDTVRLIGGEALNNTAKVYLAVKMGEVSLDNRRRAAAQLNIPESGLYRALAALKKDGVTL